MDETSGPNGAVLLPPRGAEPFRIAVGDDMLADLQERLRWQRWPKEPSPADWRYGTPTAYLRDLLGHWRDGFDWRSVEARLNRRTQYLVPVALSDGTTLRIHVIVEPGSNLALPPIVLTHGWPSLAFEFEDVLDALAHPERHGGDAATGATVIAPSLPGFGFSDAPLRPMHARDIAACWRTLMVDGFGCSRFVAHGGDWGAVVSSWLGVDAPEVLVGVHLSMMGLKPSLEGAAPLGEDEKRWVKDIHKRLAQDGGYCEQQATRPTTLAIGLADSPALVAAWIVDKYHGWTSSGLQDVPRLDPEKMLTLASLYWFTGSLPTANWIYFADRRDRHELAPGQRCEVPTGVTFFGQGFFPPPPTRWVERAHNLRFREDFADGGHFPALWKPQDFALSLRRCLDVAAFHG